MRHRQAGLTLIETVIVLMVAALIIGVIWTTYSQARLNQEVDDTVTVIDETVQSARDYLSQYSAIQGVPSNLSLSLYNNGLMPAHLSYKGAASTVVNNTGVNSDTQNFQSPLGHDFFVQYPNGSSSATPQYFEVRVGFVDAKNVYSSPDQCMKLMPRLIGTAQIIRARGLVGWSYNGYSVWDSTQAGQAFTPPAASVMPSWTTDTSGATISPSTQQTNCASAPDVRLYFAMRP